MSQSKKFAPSSGGTRSALLRASLAIALALTAFVSYRAYVSSRREKTVVEQVLRQYLAFGAMQLQEGFVTEANSCLQSWFGSSAAISAHDCGVEDAARFDFNFTTQTAKTYGRGLDPAQARLLAERIALERGVPWRENWSVGLLAQPAAGDDAIAAYAVQRTNGRPVRTLGLVSRRAGRWLLASALSDSRLLPANLTHGAGNDKLFEARLRHGPIADDAARASLTASVPSGFNGIWLQLSLREAGIELLVPGGIPGDGGLELLGLFVLALGLVFASLMLLRREAELARAQAAFVSSVSHELRTPLAQIRMFTEMLLLGRVRSDADRTRSLEIVDHEARRLSHLVENVLQVARSARCQVRVNPAEAFLSPLIRETVESFMMLEQSRQIEFRLELQDDLAVLADSEAVRQILLNLLDNAAKYGPVGQRVTVGFALFGESARLWLDDEGPGVPLRERKRVFETFYRAQRDLNSTIVGSGIGLGVVRELASLHGGSAWITEAPQGGARVVVEFPGAHLTLPQHTTDWAVA